jgi:hypothetical protein
VRELAAAESAAARAFDDPDDVTAAAEGATGGLSRLMSQVAAGSVILGEDGLQPDMEFDRLAAAGEPPTPEEAPIRRSVVVAAVLR